MSRASMAACFQRCHDAFHRLGIGIKGFARRCGGAHHPHGDDGEVRRHAHFAMAGEGNAADQLIVVGKGGGEAGGGKGSALAAKKGLNILERLRLNSGADVAKNCGWSVLAQATGGG